MATFDAALFRLQFPCFNQPSVYSDATLQMWWNTATLFVSNRDGGCFCSFMGPDHRAFAINLMTAHLVYLSQQIAAGDTPGIVTGATIDKVSVTQLAPPTSNNWQYWLNQSPYGQQLLALLQRAGVGGMIYGGRFEIGAYRRGPRGGC